MSIKVISLIWDEHQGYLSGIEKSILIKLADFGSDSGQQIFPGFTRLSLDSGFSRRTVIRTIQSLVEKKILKVKNRKSKIQNLTNLYSINVSLLKTLVSKKGSVRETLGGSGSETLGSVRETLGVVSERHPIRYIDPLHNNNKRPVDKTPIACGAVVDLKKFKITEKKSKELIEKHGEEKILYAIKHIKSQPKLTNPAGYLIKMLDDGWEPQTPKNDYPIPGPEETKAQLSQMKGARRLDPKKEIETLRGKLKKAQSANI